MSSSFKMTLVEANGHECGNAQRFQFANEVDQCFSELRSRWMGCPNTYRAEPSDDPVNYQMLHGKPVALRDWDEAVADDHR